MAVDRQSKFPLDSEPLTFTNSTYKWKWAVMMSKAFIILSEQKQEKRSQSSKKRVRLPRKKQGLRTEDSDTWQMPLCAGMPCD